MADIAPEEFRASFPDDAVPVLDEAGLLAPAAVPELAEDESADALPVGATRRPDGRVTLALRHPVTLRFRRAGSGEIVEDRVAELTFRRLVGRDVMAIAGAPKTDQTVMTLARASDTPFGRMKLLFADMDAADITAASEVLSSFLSR